MLNSRTDDIELTSLKASRICFLANNYFNQCGHWNLFYFNLYFCLFLKFKLQNTTIIF